jgi:enoyl-CoA hydratase/carnithine racemase
VLAGALGLALACDLIVARQGIRFGCPEINVGVFPFMISALIYRSVPRAKANELMMTGELITADEALALHIVNAVVPGPGFEAEVDRWAGRLASGSASPCGGATDRRAGVVYWV